MADSTASATNKRVSLARLAADWSERQGNLPTLQPVRENGGDVSIKRKTPPQLSPNCADGENWTGHISPRSWTRAGQQPRGDGAAGDLWDGLRRAFAADRCAVIAESTTEVVIHSEAERQVVDVVIQSECL